MVSTIVLFDWTLFLVEHHLIRTIQAWRVNCEMRQGVPGNTVSVEMVLLEFQHRVAQTTAATAKATGIPECGLARLAREHFSSILVRSL